MEVCPTDVRLWPGNAGSTNRSRVASSMQVPVVDGSHVVLAASYYLRRTLGSCDLSRPDPVWRGRLHGRASLRHFSPVGWFSSRPGQPDMSRLTSWPTRSTTGCPCNTD